MDGVKTYRINDSRAISETVDGETIIINLENGNYYSLNHAGTIVWDFVIAQKPLDASEKNIVDFIAFLVNENLILETETAKDAILEKIILEKLPTIEKYEDMQQMLLADPIHDVEAVGWPKLKKDM
jgi:hypothetical protein